MTANVKTPTATPTLYQLDSRAAFYVMQAAAVVMASVHTCIPPEERGPYVQAALRAVDHLLAGCAYRREGDVVYFQSSSQPDEEHAAQRGICECRASAGGRVCWHRPASEMVKLLDQRARDFKRRDDKISDELAGELHAGGMEVA